MRILLVDDEPGIAGALSAFLRLHGMDVQEANDFKTAARFLESEEWSFLITDHNLPDGYGMDLCRRFCGKGLGIALLLSARPDPSFESLEEEEGFFFLPKPIAPGKLLRWIRDHESSLPSSEEEDAFPREVGASDCRHDPFKKLHAQLSDRKLSSIEIDHCLCALFPSLLHGELVGLDVSEEVVAFELSFSPGRERFPLKAVEEPFPGSDLWLVRNNKGDPTGIQVRVFRRASAGLLGQEEEEFEPRKFNSWEDLLGSYRKDLGFESPWNPSWLRFGLEVLRRERAVPMGPGVSPLNRLLWTRTDGLGEFEQ